MKIASFQQSLMVQNGQNHCHLVIIHCAVNTQKIFPKISVAQLNWLDRSATSCEWLIDNRASLSLTAKHNFTTPEDDNDGE